MILILVAIFSPIATPQSLIKSAPGGASGGGFGPAICIALSNAYFGESTQFAGTPRDNHNGADAGMVTIYDFLIGKTTKIYGANPGDQFGTSLLTIDDLNGDMTPEVVVGAPGAAVGGVVKGAVYILDGITGAILATHYGSTANSNFGAVLGGAGDANGDQKRDIAVGAPFDTTNGFASGAVYILSGTNLALLRSFYGDTVGDEFGSAISHAASYDNEIAVGAPLNSFFLNDRGQVKYLKTTNGAVKFVIYGSAVGDHFGASVDVVSDVNGDNVSDIAIGAPHRSVSYSDAGQVIVVSGTAGSTLMTFNGLAAGDELGTAVANYGSPAYSWYGLPPALPPQWFVIGAPNHGLNGANSGMAEFIQCQPNPNIIFTYGLTAGERYGAAIVPLYTSVSAGISGQISVFTAIAIASPGADDPANGSNIVDIGKITTSHLDASGSTAIYSTDDIYYGPAYGDRVGSSVAIVGDVNNDGYADWAVGATDADTGAGDSGRVVLISGKDGSVIYTWNGGFPVGNFGAAVAAAGDYNLDGVPDILIGEPHANSGLFGSNPDTGAAYVYSGKTGLLLHSITGTNAGDELGIAVASGDINNDGWPEIVAGAPYSSAAGIIAGQVVVVSGHTGFVIYTFNGAAADHLGASVAVAGDVNHDGYNDILAGAPNHNGAFSGGNARLFSGKTGAILSFFSPGIGTYEFATSVGGGSDVNRDGYVDIIIGSPADSNAGLTDCGSARVYSGKTFASLYVEFGASAGDGLGTSVAMPGDINNDGYADFAAGAPKLPGFLSFTNPYVRVYSGKDGSFQMGFVGSTFVDREFGASIAGGGDINKDGFPDLVVGSPGSFAYGNNSGAAYAYSLVPKGVGFYGNGTPGCSGLELLSTNSPPSIGNAGFAFTTNKGPANALGLGIVGNAALPNGGDPFGIGVSLGIDLILSTDVYTFDHYTDALGYGAGAIGIPNNPAVVGQTYYAQVLSLWPAANCTPSPLGLSTSRPVSLIIQQ
ncbi:MAG: FG-GAP repeat protein [Planctomycetes bacterium]|nr:FG-GAP repeat protein [Planctomycetota bacterium]